MAATTEEKREAVAKREQLEQNPSSYYSMRNEFITSFEASDNKHTHVYTIDGIKHVGIGFNMEQGNARGEWAAAFPDTKTRPDFDKVLKGTFDLSSAQVDALFAHSLDMRDDQLIERYGQKTWNKLKPNEKLIIEDLYYNGADSLVGPKTSFFKNIQNYTATGDRKFLDYALWEVKHNSNNKTSPHLKKGIQRRRDLQAEMLNTGGLTDLDNLQPPPYKNAPATATQSSEAKLPEGVLQEARATLADLGLPMTNVDTHGPALTVPGKTSGPRIT